MPAPYCCKEFEEQATDHEAYAGGGMMYPDNPDTQFEKLDDGAWAINGCCGGGCFVVSG